VWRRRRWPGRCGCVRNVLTKLDLSLDPAVTGVCSSGGIPAVLTAVSPAAEPGYVLPECGHGQ
jgi:hypothetical protein